MKKTIIITGGAGRIGSAIAKNLIENGYEVILNDIDKSKLIKIHKKINSKNLNFYQSDPKKKKNIEKFFKLVLSKYKNIHGAVHCSYPKSKKWGTKFENLKQKNLNEDLQNQLGSSIIFSQVLIKQFLKQKKGNLIFISSIQGVQPPKFTHYKNLGMSSPIEYSAIKAGIISITKYLSKYYKNKNIRINCISPGGIKDKQPRAFIRRYKESCNSKGLLDADDIAKSIMFLLSEKSQYINGQNLIIDDGWSL